MEQAHEESDDSSSLMKLGGCKIPQCTCKQYLDTIEKLDEDLL